MWNDNDDDAGERPDSVLVHLWCDRVQYAEVVLSAENGWTYTWDELPAGHEWAVSERVVSGYYLQVSRTGTTFLMTNNFDEELFELDEQGVPRGRRDGGDEEEYEDFGDEVPRGRLAQTGLLWWPVAALAGAGLLLSVAGFAVYRKNEDEDE